MAASIKTNKSVAEQVLNDVHEVHTDDRNSNVVEEVYGAESPHTGPQSSEDRVTAERHLIRKLDMRFMPTVLLMYFMNYIDVGLASRRCKEPRISLPYREPLLQ